MSMRVCINNPTPFVRVRRVYISGVDFGCFSTVYRDCEALEEREEQVKLHAFLFMFYFAGSITGASPEECPRVLKIVNFWKAQKCRKCKAI